MSAKALVLVIALQALACAGFKLPTLLRSAVEPVEKPHDYDPLEEPDDHAEVHLATVGPAHHSQRLWQACALEASRELNILGSKPTVLDPTRKFHCTLGSSRAFFIFGTFLVAWIVATLFVLLARYTRGWEEETPCERDCQWDRARYHLMTIIIWTHWLGKWGLSRYRSGWAFLSWAFSFHVIAFVFLSGVFSRRYTAAFASLGQLNQVGKRCLDLFLVYVAFSWLRGAIYVLSSPPSFRGTVVDILHGTFKFHQGPWYMGALCIWRLSTLALWWTPLALVVAVVLAVLCPYNSLEASGDPYAIREVLHYLPYFTLGLLCGQKRLETAVTCLGSITSYVGLLVLLVLAAVIWFPLGWLFDDPALRWILLKKAVPPSEAGGIFAMLALYIVKMLSTIAALMVFSAPCGVSLLDRTFEAVGRRSMTVYLVHMVFILEPGDQLCIEHQIKLFANHSGMFVSLVLLAFAVAVNLLCGSVLTARAFRPLTEPVATFGELTSFMWERAKAGKEIKETL